MNRSTIAARHPRWILTFIALAILVMPSDGRAELRILGVRVTKSPDQDVRVCIASDVAKEKKKNITIEDAVDILSEAKGWGSSVVVGVVAHEVPLRDFLPLLEAISENLWLDLAFVDGRKTDFLMDNVRKKIREESITPAKPEEE